MKTDNGALHFEVDLEMKQLLADLEVTKRKIRGLAVETEKETMKMDQAFSRVGTMLKTYLGAQLARQLVQVRGEFQQLDVAFTTMLGSKAKAEQLMAQIVDTAAKTPFTLTEVASGAKQLLAYQVAAEDVNETVIRLGNISAGVSVPLSRLILAYGQVKAKGRLMGDDLRQFTEAGIPIIHELAKVTGTADENINKMVEDGKIGFAEVQKVIQNLTNEGGMFFNLMAEQSKTLTGQLSNLQDAWDRMLNDVGSQNDNILSGIITGATSVVEHYQDIVDILIPLAASYGAYKAAVLATVAANRAAYISESLALEKLLTTEQLANVSKLNLSKSSMAYRDAIKAEIASNIANMQSQLIQLRATEAAAKAEYKIALQRSLNAKISVSQKEMELSLATLSGEAKQIELAQNSLLQAQEERHIAVKARKAVADNYSIAQSKTKSVVTAIETATGNQNAISTNTQTGATKFLTAAKVQLTGVTATLNKVMMNNPLAITAAAIAGLTFLIYRYVSAQMKLTQSEESLQKVKETSTSQVDEEIAKIKTLTDIINNENISLEKRNEAIGKLKEIVPGYHASLSAEGKLIDNNKESLDEYIKSFEKSIKLQAAQDELAELYKKQRIQEKSVESAKKRSDLIYERNKPLDVVYGGEAGIAGQEQRLTAIRRANRELEDAQDELTETKNAITAINEEIGNIFNKNPQKVAEQISQLNVKLLEEKKKLIEFQSSVSSATQKDIDNQERTIIELEKQLETLTAIQKELGDIPITEDPKTVAEQISQLNAKLLEERKKLIDFRKSNSTATPKEIENQEKTIQDLEKQLETLTGIKQKEIEKSKKSDEKSKEERLESEQKYNDALLDIQDQNEKKRISLISDANQKKREEIANQYRYEIRSIHDHEKELIKLYNESNGLKEGDKGYTTQLPEPVTAVLNNMRILAGQNYNSSLEDLAKESKSKFSKLLLDYQTVHGKMLASEKEFNEDLKVLNNELQSSIAQDEIKQINDTIEGKKQVYSEFLSSNEAELQANNERMLSSREQYNVEINDLNNQLLNATSVFERKQIISQIEARKQAFQNEQEQIKSDYQKTKDKQLAMEIQFNQELSELNSKLYGSRSNEEIAQINAAYAAKKEAFEKEKSDLEQELTSVQDEKLIMENDYNDEILELNNKLLGKLSANEIEQIKKIIAKKTKAYAEAQEQIEAEDKAIKDKLLSSEERYNKEILEMNTKLLGAKSAEEIAKIQDSIEARKQAFQSEQSKLAVEELTNSDAWIMLFENLDDLTATQIDKLIKEIEAKFADLSVKFDPIDLDIILSKLKEAKEIVYSENPFKQLGIAFKKVFEDAQDDSKEAASNIKKDWNNLAAATQSTFDFITDAIDSAEFLQDSIGEVGKTAISSLAAVAMASIGVAKAIKTAETASVILAIVQAAIIAIQATMDVIEFIVNQHDKKIKRSIEAHKKNVEELKLAYDELERAISKAIGTEYYDLAKDQIANLKQQISDIKEKIEEAQNIKNDKDRAEEIAEYTQDLIDAENELEDLFSRLQEHILTMSIETMAQNLGDAIVDAFAAGEDAAEAWGKSVDDIVKNIVKNLIVQNLFANPLENIIQGYFDQWMDQDGNFLMSWDEIAQSALQMGKDITDLGTNGLNVMNALPKEIRDLVLGDTGIGNSLSGAIQGVSEETASILAGQMNAIRINQIESVSILKNQLYSLNAIANNTSNINRIYETLKTIERNNHLRSFGIQR